MPRPIALIQSEIAVIEARLQSADSFVQSAGSDGTNLSNTAREELTKRLDQLYMQADRASGRGRMLVRGRLDMGSR